MEMEIVKPFGDDVASEEADVICLSKQKVKLHFYRWTVQKDSPALLISDFASVTKSESEIPPPQRIKDKTAIDAKKHFVIPQEVSDVQVYAEYFSLTEYIASTQEPVVTYQKDKPSITTTVIADPGLDNAWSFTIKEKDKTFVEDKPQYDKAVFPELTERNLKLANQKNQSSRRLVMASEKVHSGYLYIFHELQSGTYSYEEFYVDEKYKLNPVVHCDEISSTDSHNLTRDVRPIRCRGTQDCYEYSQPRASTSETIWTAFSLVQWKESQLIDKPWWKQRTQPVVCRPWKHPKENPNFNNGYVSYFEDTSPTPYEREASKGLNTPITFNPKALIDRSSPPKNSHAMRVFLDDPIYLADRISDIVERELDELARLVKSIEGGIPPDRVGLDSPSQDAQYLHLLTVAAYKFAFSSDENIDTYVADTQEERLNAFKNLLNYLFTPQRPDKDGVELDFTKKAGIDRPLLEKLLAVTDRSLLCGAINTYRNDLGALLISDRYQSRLTDYLQNTETRKNYGKCITLKHLSTLTKQPGSIDNHLRLEKDAENVLSDFWITEAGKIETGDAERMKSTVSLINSDLNYDLFFDYTKKEIELSCPSFLTHIRSDMFDQKSSCDIAAIVALSLTKCIVEAANDLAEARMAWMPTVAKPSVFRSNIDGYHALPQDSIEQENSYQKLYNIATLTMKIIQSNNSDSIDIDRKNEIISLKKNNKMKIQNCTILLGNTPTAFDEVIFILVENKKFRIVELLLLGLDFNQEIRKNPDGVSEHISRALNLTTILTDALSASETFSVVKSIKNKFSLAKTLFTISARASLVLCIATSIMDVMIAEKNRDNDAALAYCASGIFSVTAAVVGIVVGWPAFILACIAAGFWALAIYLTDTPLESYFKFFPLAAVKVGEKEVYDTLEDAKLKTIEPYEAVQALCKSMSLLCSRGDTANEDRDDSTFEKSYVKLMDFLCPLSIELRTIASSFRGITTNTNEYKHQQPTTVYKGKVEKLQLKMTSLTEGIRFTNPDNSLDVMLFTDAGEDIPCKITPETNPSRHNDSLVYSADISFDNNRIKGVAHLLIRLIISNECMPLEYRGSARYFVFKIYAMQHKDESIETQNGWFCIVKEPATISTIDEFRERLLRT